MNKVKKVENYISNMFFLPERGLGIVILIINMNAYLVTNQLADIISTDSPAEQHSIFDPLKYRAEMQYRSDQQQYTPH